jgi:hypothetical protein
MARYYFHLKQGDEVVTDEEGQELPSLGKATAMAVNGARELVASAMKNGRDLQIYAIVIEDDSGQTTLLPLAEVVPKRFRG